ncbi:hypothetical protein ROLI_017830 [Roseobacter fucihabitans]|uniref:Flagellar motor switch protein FliN-like C-terminal domain-containing protein n=1 Tax=Roseobacter fucihabitans TaxID=1537242 RepID=A0ABZ2BU23_9RHOB|nr:FliM/FliN family flagellar motor switch protein [Roseobacter litoralis]MBC6964342.1 flagellar motor switch protein FliM [Roseobacter litoralis]
MSVLQRKAQAGKQEHQARAMSVPKALRVSIAKVADEIFEMALAVIGATQELCGGDDLSTKIEEGSLLVLLDGPRGCAGGAILGPELVAAVIQQQTMGKVFDVSSSDRELTETDAALCAPLLDAVFQRAHGLLERDSDRDILCPYKFGARVETPRLFALALDELEYHLFKLTIDIAGGTGQSGLTLLLPVLEKGAGAAEPDEPEVPKPVQTLEKSVMNIKAELTAVLARLRIPIVELGRLSPGDVLTLDPDAFDSVEIVTRDRRVISRGSMGQLEGKRAVQLENRDSDAGRSNKPLEQRGPMGLPNRPAVPGPAVGNASEGLPEIGLDAIEHESFEVPDLPDLPALDDAGDLPDFSDLPGLSEDGGLPELPDLPDLPDLEGDGTLPSLEDLPDFKIA